MTQVGEGVSVATISEEDVEGLYFLRYILLDENGKPIAGVPYKTVKAGSSAKPQHIADGKTARNGTTTIVSSTKDEEIDFYIAWAKLKVNKGFFKM